MRRLVDPQRRRELRLLLNGQVIKAYEGETVAAALLATDHAILRSTPGRGEPRGVFCGMGVCFECLMRIDGRPNQQACVTVVNDGMRVETQVGNGDWSDLP